MDKIKVPSHSHVQQIKIKHALYNRLKVMTVSNVTSVINDNKKPKTLDMPNVV